MICRLLNKSIEIVNWQPIRFKVIKVELALMPAGFIEKGNKGQGAV